MSNQDDLSSFLRDPEIETPELPSSTKQNPLQEQTDTDGTQSPSDRELSGPNDPSDPNPEESVIKAPPQPKFPEKEAKKNATKPTPISAHEDTSHHTNSLVNQALAIRQNQLKRLATNGRSSRQALTPGPRTPKALKEASRSATSLEDHKTASPTKLTNTHRPNYSYLSPQNLVKHDQEQHAERLRRKEDRERIERTRLMNLATAREKEATKQREREEVELQLAEAAHRKEAEEPSYIKFPTIHGEASLVSWSRLKDKVWRPAGRLTKKKAERLAALGYTSSAPRNEPNNTFTLRSAYGCVTDGGNEPSGVASLKSEPRQVTAFDPAKFERTTLQKQREREQKQKEEQWSHIRLIQKKRRECVDGIEKRKLQDQQKLINEQEEIIALSRAGLVAEMESKKEQIATSKEAERAHQRQVEKQKELRRKEIMERALQVRIEFLEDAAKQSEFDYTQKSNELSTRERHRRTLIIALDEQRTKRQNELLAEQLLRHEGQMRDQKFAEEQEKLRVARREEKLARVQRNRDDAVRNFEAQRDAKLKIQMESDWIYDTLRKKKAPHVPSTTTKSKLSEFDDEDVRVANATQGRLEKMCM